LAGVNHIIEVCERHLLALVANLTFLKNIGDKNMKQEKNMWLWLWHVPHWQWMDKKEGWMCNY